MDTAFDILCMGYQAADSSPQTVVDGGPHDHFEDGEQTFCYEGEACASRYESMQKFLAANQQSIAKNKSILTKQFTAPEP